MENIVQSNNRDLRLVALKVGVLSTLRLALPDVPASATRVEVIVTNGDTHTAYGAHLDTDTERWLVDIAAAQFPVCGKQKYEIAYLLDGKQFWDGSGWVTVEDATTGGLTPSPAPDPARYVVTRINGYGAPNPDGEVRIPRTFVGAEDPTTTDGFIEFDQYLNKETGALFVLCSVEGTLTWVKTAGAVFSVNGMVGAVEVQTLKINDEWRFSVAPGLSGEMAIRLEHLDFPAQGIWGIQTEMTIPTGLGTLAKSADIPEISTTFTSDDAGKAADAKAVGEALMGKVDVVAVKEEFLPITDVNETYDLSSYTIRKGGEYYSAYDASGNIMCSWRLDGVWMAGDSGIRFNGRTPPGDIPMLMFGATISDIADATKLTPVLATNGRVTGYKLGDKASPVLLTDDAKAALFAGADFISAVKKYGGTQIKEDEKGFYYEVDEEA